MCIEFYLVSLSRLALHSSRLDSTSSIEAGKLGLVRTNRRLLLRSRLQAAFPNVGSSCAEAGGDAKFPDPFSCMLLNYFDVGGLCKVLCSCLE